MSASEGSLGSSSPAASAPPPAPAVAPSAPATDSAVAPAAAEPVASPETATAPATPGASTASPTTKPTTLDEVSARYHQQIDGIAEQEAAPPEATAPTELPLIPEVAEPAETPLTVAEPETVTEPLTAEPAAEETAPAHSEIDLDDLNQVLSLDDIKAKFPRQSVQMTAEFAKREAHRAELMKSVGDIGGEIGVEFAKVVNPIIWKENPTIEDVDALFDQIVLPEHANAEQLFKLMGEHLINTTLQDETHGREFGANLISEEYGKNKDGSPYDFGGMKPLELVETLINAHKAGILNMEFITSELAGQDPTPEPSPRELALQKENEELKSGQQAKETEHKRERDALQAQYKTQANGFVSRRIMSAVMPLAVSANWAAIEGETGPQVERKQVLGELVTDHINRSIEGSLGAPSEEYAAVQTMIDEGRAFDAAGKPTPRFLQKLGPLQEKARARFLRIQRVLAPEFKFKAENSRNAQLVNKNGGSKAAQTAVAPPPEVAEIPKPVSQKNKSTQELIDEKLAVYRQRLQDEAATPGLLA